MSDLESVSSVEALEFPVDEEEGDELIVEEVKRFAHSIGLNGASEAEHDVTILANSTTHPKADVGASENLKQASFITPPKQTEIESNHDMVVESGNRKVSKGIRDHENQLMGYQPLPVKKMLFNFEVSGSWHEEDSGMVAKYPLQVHVLKHLEEKASELLASDVQLYEKFRLRKRKSDVEWLRTVMTSGTLTDKTSARALLVQESPIHNIAALDALLVMCRKKAKRESIQAIDMLKELWLTCLLPPKRKLKLFAARPFSSLFDVKNPVSAHDRDRKVMLWYAESQFKSCYRDYIGVLEVHLHDPVASVRIKILGTVFDLLVQRPEQEQTLLSLLVNKLGDPERKVASRSSFYLLKLGRSVLPVVHFLPLLYYLPMVYFLFWYLLYLLSGCSLPVWL
jgi:ribosome biogenesis protein MAK21